jgi:hypothetical protein
MINVKLTDATGKHHQACVTPHNALCVAEVTPEPPAVGEESRVRALIGLLGQSGLNSGNTDMSVVGSLASPVEFFVRSSEDFDIRVMAIQAIIVDSPNTPHNSFGALAALTNGWDLTITEAGETTALVDKAKTNGDTVLQMGAGRPFGNQNDSFILTNWDATNNATVAYFPIWEYVPNGLRLGRGTLDKISGIVNDDLSGLTSMIVRIFGYRHYP